MTGLGISADVAQFNGWRLRPDHVYIPHVLSDGKPQMYRRRCVGSRMTLSGQMTIHNATTVYFPRHPVRSSSVLDYLKDYSEPLILCDSLIDSIYLQSQVIQSGINAQVVYIRQGHYPKLDVLLLSTIDHQKRVWITRNTSKALTDHLRLQGAICHTLKHSTQYADPVQAIRAGESLAEMMQVSIKASVKDRKQALLAKSMSDDDRFTQWLETLPRQVYKLNDLHSQYVHDTGSTIGKLQLSALIDHLLPATARRAVIQYLQAISYRRKATTQSLTLIAIRQQDYWERCSNAQWLAEYEQRYNTRSRID